MILSADEAKQRIAMYRSHFKGWSMFEVDGHGWRVLHPQGIVGPYSLITNICAYAK
jgi:hypothetical protein